MNPKVILLVEDNADDEALTLRALAKNNLANTIDVVRDGVEALDYLLCRGKYEKRSQELKPQLILLDIKLPKMDGLEVLKAIRNDKNCKHIPVVMLTTSDREDDIAKSYENGANSFIRKPVDFKEFIDAITQLSVYWLVLNSPTKD